MLAHPRPMIRHSEPPVACHLEVHLCEKHPLPVHALLCIGARTLRLCMTREEADRVSRELHLAASGISPGPRELQVVEVVREFEFCSRSAIEQHDSFWAEYGDAYSIKTEMLPGGKGLRLTATLKE